MERIRGAFPEDARSVDSRIQSDGFVVEDAPHIWVEHFSQLTTDALKGGDMSTFEAHLTLLSSLLSTADAPTTRCNRYCLR